MKIRNKKTGEIREISKNELVQYGLGGKLNKLGVKNSLWNNIRANKGSGKKPTPQMLEQERKIKANMAMGGQMYGMGGSLNMYQNGDVVGNPNYVALGAMNPRTNKPYSETEVARYYNSKDMLDMLNSTAAKLGDFRENNYGGINNKNQISQGSFNNGIVPNQAPSRVFSPKVDYAQRTLTPTSLKDRVSFTPPAMDSNFDMNQIPQELMYNNSFNVAKSANKPFGQLPSNTKFNLQAPGNNMEQSFLRQDTTPQEVIPYFEDPGFDINAIDPALMYNTPESSYANKPFNQLPIGITRPNTNLNLGEFGANANRYVSPENLTMENIGTTTPGKTGQGFFNKAGQFIQNNPGLVGQLGTAALTAGIQSNRINSLARPRTLGDVRLSDKVFNPNLVDYSAERQAYNRMGLNAMGEAQRGFGSSAAAQAFKNKARLNTLEGTGKSYQAQENANALIFNTYNKDRQDAAIREAMINNDISKYNAENVYGYDENRSRDLNAITGQMGNVAGQTFGNITANKNQLKQLEMLAKGNYKGVNKKTLDDLYSSGNMTAKKYKELTGVDPQPISRNGGMMGRSFRNGGTNNPGFKALPEAVQENILNNMGMGGYMYSLGGRLMNDPMFAEGGTTPKNTLGLTGDYSRNNTPQNIISNYNLKADYARRFGDFNAGLNANLGFENTLPMKPEEVSVMRPNANIGVNLNYERPTSNFGTTFNYNPLNQDINANLTYRKRFAEGGKLPKSVLQSRLEAHMSPEEVNLYLSAYADGGIHIKPSKVGSLRKHLGTPAGEKIPMSKLADKPGDSPAIKKKKVFARNARKWNS